MIVISLWGIWYKNQPSLDFFRCLINHGDLSAEMFHSAKISFFPHFIPTSLRDELLQRLLPCGGGKVNQCSILSTEDPYD